MTTWCAREDVEKTGIQASNRAEPNAQDQDAGARVITTLEMERWNLMLSRTNH